MFFSKNSTLDDDYDAELDAIETMREREALERSLRESSVLFNTRKVDPKSAVVLQINNLSLTIRLSKGQNNELLLKRAKLYLTNECLDATYIQSAYEDLKAIIKDLHHNSRPNHQEIKTRAYQLVETNYRLHQRLLAYEEELGDHQVSKRARTIS